MKYNRLNLGQIEAIVNKLGGMDGVQRLLAGELTVSPRLWREQDGVIYFSVTSDGTTDLEWIKRLERKGFQISDYAKSVLLSGDFKPTSGVTTEVAVLKGMLFADKDRITKKIRAEAKKRKFTKINAEDICLIREKFMDEELKAMNLWGIIAMHKPFKDSCGELHLLSAYRVDSQLDTYCDDLDREWHREIGFAFSASQVNSKS